jgi:radical SAM protein with 4Fe4S-binding SPASM domain
MSKLKQQIKRLLPESILFLYRFICHSDTRKDFLFRRFGIRYSVPVPAFPPMVMIDTTTRCNLACRHCPSSILSEDPNWRADMDVELYKKIIDEIADENLKTIVRPFDGGEPLLREDIEELIKYAKQKGISYVSLNTNGILLNEKRALSILDSGLDHLEISIDAFSEETYKALKRANAYAKVTKNVETLLKLKDRIRPEFKVSVSFVKQSENIHECEAFCAYWKNKVNNVVIREYHSHGGLVGNQGTLKSSQKQYRRPCPYLWNRIIVQHNGKVRFCENDWKAEHALGNVKKQSLKQIWQSEGFRRLRASHIEGSFDHPFCKKCSDWKVFD